jgi:predicted NUDIX family NTP pyrophosphohydrolase
MAKKSAGIIAYRTKDKIFQVLLVHPGGPYWSNKDAGAWSIPKGEFTEDEEPLIAAIREFKEETGLEVNGDFISLPTVRTKSGKLIFPFAVEADFDVSNIISNTCTIEWPVKSGKQLVIPEVDKAEWFDIITAYKMINSSQGLILDELMKRIFAADSNQLKPLREQ